MTNSPPTKSPAGNTSPSGLACDNHVYPQLVLGATNRAYYANAIVATPRRRRGTSRHLRDLPVRRRAREDAASVKTTCPVCLTVNYDVAIVPCGHCVCPACMQNITSAAVGSARCPVCRGDINNVLCLHFPA